MVAAAERAAGRPSPLAEALKEAALTAVVAFALAVPLVGFHLVDVTGGVELHTRFGWVALAVAAVFAGRFALAFTRITGRRVAVSLPMPAALKGAGRWIGWAGLGVAAVLPFLPGSDRYAVDTAITVLIYVMLGWGLNVVVGLAGLLDLGYVAFYAVGAYSYALFAQHFQLTFWECLPLAGAFAAGFGVLLGFPVLRLRGDYLAIVTLGFGEMIRVILLNWQSFTGGPNGLHAIPRPSFFGHPFTAAPPDGVTAFHELVGIEFAPEHRQIFLFYVILVLALATNYVTLRMRRLPLGRAWEALREDETACRALGINPTNTKLTAFAIGAMFAGLAGSFFATRQGFVSPESFTFIESAVILAIVVLGGMGSQTGVVIAALFFIVVPEIGREFAQFRMLLFGLAMVAIMLWRPQGLVSHREPSAVLKPAGAASS